MTGQTAPPVFFLHGPKAGGTAIKYRFDRAYAPEDISPTIEALPSERDPSLWKTFAGFRFISGHCGYEVYRAIGANHLLVSNFRNPIDRVVSLYDYWRNNFAERDSRHAYPTLNASRFAKQLTFAEFIRSDEYAIKLYIRDAQARQLLSTAWEYRELNFIDLFKLKRRIKRMHWFYICESADLSEQWFRHQFPEIQATPLTIENATNYSEKPKTVPTQADIAVLESYNTYDRAIYDFAASLLQQRMRKLTESSLRRSRFRLKRVANALDFIARLPNTIAQIESRIAAIENSGPSVAPAVAAATPAAATPVAEVKIVPSEEPAIAEPVNPVLEAEPSRAHYLAYAEQIPRGRPIYIVGLDTMASWTLRLLRSRDYAVTAFIADVNSPPESYRAVPVVERSQKLKELSADDVVIIASPHRDSLVDEFKFTDNLFDATELFQFVTEFCEKDTSDILIDDLAISYWRTTREQADKYGEVWRRLKKLPTHQYVRNIENAVGPGSRYVVNIGCHDGISVDPCYPLYKDGWTGWASDGKPADHPVARAAQKNLALPGVSLTLGTFIKPDNVKDLLKQHGAPLDCDLIKIDIDSYDGPVIETMLEGGWRPRVFCVEINADFPPPFRFMVEYDAAEAQTSSSATAEMTNELAPWHVGMYGCSAAWAAQTFAKYGYKFAQYEFGFPKMIGGIRDMVFIRDDVFEASQATPGIAWDDAYYAEPLGWSHVKSGLKIDIRDWRHASDLPGQAAAIKAALGAGTRKALGREIAFTLDY